MANARSSRGCVTQPDEFPPRPTNVVQNELNRMNSLILKREKNTLVLLCIAFFFYGLSVGLYGPLYPQEAMNHGFKTHAYAPVITVQFLAAVLYYPVACMMLNRLACTLAIALGLFVTGTCKILFGTLPLVTDAIAFIFLSYGIQIADGIGFGIVLAATSVTYFSEVTQRTKHNRGVMQTFFVLGICLGPVVGETLYQSFNFSAAYYSIGSMLCLSGFILAFKFPEPDQKITSSDITFVSWVKKPKMFIYFLVVFTTFIYIGYFAATLDLYLKQFILTDIFLGVLFAVPTIFCGLFAPSWMWMCKKGLNSVLLICISSLLVFASLLYIGSPPFINDESSIANVSIALSVCGFATGGKLACLVYTAYRDYSFIQDINGIQEHLMIPTMFGFGALLGSFSGSFISGFAYDFIGMGEAMYILLGIEAITIILAFIFAFKRNYRSPRGVNPILTA